MSRTILAEDVKPGMVLTDGASRFAVKHVDHHVRVRNSGEFGRPAIGKVWLRGNGNATWIVDVGDHCELVK